MLNFALLVLSSMMLIFLLKFLSYLISEHTATSREELSSYECGFEHHNVSRVPVSLRYFLLTLLFLLFDLEIVFLLFLPYLYASPSPMVVLFITFIFTIFLLITLVYEWSDGTLDWLA